MALDVLDAPASEPFLERLQKEKLESQKRRGTLVQKKLVWVSGLSAIGAIQSVTLNVSESADAVTAALSAESWQHHRPRRLRACSVAALSFVVPLRVDSPLSRTHSRSVLVGLRRALVAPGRPHYGRTEKSGSGWSAGILPCG